jgi:hypothetical protein
MSAPLPPADRAAARFWPKVSPADEGGCQLWTGGLRPDGRGQFHPTSATTVLAHRYAWQAVHGPLPEGVDLRNTCGTPSCVVHWQPVSHAEPHPHNITAGNASKTRCPQGHDYSPENTRTEHRPDGRTFRHCRACHRERARARRAA